MGNSALAQLSTTASNNIAIGGVSVDELCAMGNLNDGIRALAAAAVGALSFVTTSGTNTYTATLAPAIDAYTTDFLYCVWFASANTATAPTLNLNSVGAKTITRVDGSALVAGDLNGPHALVYHGTNLRVLNPAVSSLFTTGDVKATLKTTADSDWVMKNDGTIGDASSGGTSRANADTSALFTLLWNNVSNTNCHVSGGRGASAAADFAAHKTISVPKMLGRALASAGAGSGLTSRNLGDTTGAETVTLTQAQVPVLTIPILSGSIGNAAGAVSAQGLNGGDTDLVTDAGGGGSHTNMQPSAFLNFMVKL